MNKINKQARDILIDSRPTAVTKEANCRGGEEVEGLCRKKAHRHGLQCNECLRCGVKRINGDRDLTLVVNT